MRVISLGWGVQSFALAAMSALGELPPVDAAVHADTTHERTETYAFAEKWTPWLEERGVRVITVSDKKAANVIFGEGGQTHLPAFTLQAAGHKTQKQQHGQLRRSCTHRWKIVPQRRWISAELKQRDLSKSPNVVEQQFGITRDEWTRMKDSDVKYIHNAYPFMDAFEPPMTRNMVIRWLLDNELGVPPKSACVFCPYHNLGAWREIRDSNNGDWARAVHVDNVIRDKRPGYKSFIHPSCVPLEQVDLRSQQDHGQLELWPQEECTGMCFL